MKISERSEEIILNSSLMMMGNESSAVGRSAKGDTRFTKTTPRRGVKSLSHASRKSRIEVPKIRY
jgi:hypothetical protein